VVVADGLGHGPDAAEAADAALAVFDRCMAGGPYVDHARRRSHGAVGPPVATLDARPAHPVCRAGNILGRVISGIGDRTLVSQSGTAGVQVRTQEQEMEWPLHALVILHSDGIQSAGSSTTRPCCSAIRHRGRLHLLEIRPWPRRRHRRGGTPRRSLT
jgi:hypothetical protein